MTRIQRRWGAVCLGLLTAAATAALVLPQASRSVDGSSQSALPALGSADSEAVMMGSATDRGETWAYRQLPLSVGSVKRDGQPLEFGSPSNPAFPEPQLAFLRHTDAGGWQVYETPQDQLGRPYRGPSPNKLSVRITADSGGVLIGRDGDKPGGAGPVALVRDPGRPFKLIPDPAPGQLLPGEAIADDRGLGAVADAALQEGGRTGLLAAPQGADKVTGILHWDGTAWMREPIDPNPGQDDGLQILQIAATDPGNAWALGRTDPSLGRGVVLLKRTGSGAGARWQERSLGSSQFARADTPAKGITGLAPLGGSAQSLTVTGDRVWVDGTLTAGERRKDFTFAFDPAANAVSRSWCDSSVCDARLGAGLARSGGYRSYAWSGAGDGTRIVTNPIDAGAGEDTNRGTYLRLESESFRRMPGAGGNFRPSGAFASPESGWLEGPVQITGQTAPRRLRVWPASLRTPLADVTGEPGAAPGALGSRALAVGSDGGVLRYIPGRGWQREFLLNPNGSVSKDALRGVAWAEPRRANAVGDLGAMWQWNADNGLWEPDPGMPVGFEGNLMDVAFKPGDPDRGYAVGKEGVLLSYSKSWDQEALPPGYASADLTKIAFAGNQALVAAGRGLLVNDGGGWREDAGVRALLDSVGKGDGNIYSVAGLPDGGAVAAGRNLVIERDGPGSPWRFSDQPLPGVTVVALGAFREGGALRAVASVLPRLTFPVKEVLPPTDPNSPPPIAPPFGLPGDGYVLRENARGWGDEQRAAYAGSGPDRPLKSDPLLSFDLDASGNGWAVGGWSGEADAAGRGTSARNAAGRSTRDRVQTGGVYRYGSDSGAPPPAAGGSPVPQPSGPVRLAVGGNAQCETSCSDLREQSIGPDSTLLSALARARSLRGGAGPRAFLYTGGRQKTALGAADASRYAELLGSQPGLPVYPALAAGDSAAGTAAFSGAFSSFAAPFGGGAPPAGISSAGIPGAGAAAGTRTHYAFDTSGDGGTVRVVVLDNSSGSLAASDPHQNPAEPQRPWLISVLADARARGIPSVVMGNRDLNTRFQPRLNTATDGDDVARVLVDGGASAYVFDRPEENRALRIPSGGSTTIPTFGSGTLGYRSPIKGGSVSGGADSLFGDSGFLLLEVNAAQRNGATNRAPVSARLVPVIEDASLEAVDGTLLRRSRPSLFRGLGRRPRGGDRWGRVAAGDGNPNPPGGDPYTPFPADQCLVAGCSARINPEYQFTSSDTAIADFVRQDPNSTNLRKPLQDAKGKVVSDSSSGLLCPFNAGTTTVSVRAGGFAYSQTVTVQQGSVQQPCGTRPLNSNRFKRPVATATPPPPPPPPPAPAGNPPASLPSAPASPPVPAPPPPAIVPPLATAPPASPGRPSPPEPFLPPPPAVLASLLPVIVPPPPPPVVRPLPPGGVAARVYQVEEKKEEEAATEESQAFSRYEPDDGGGVPPWSIGLVVLAAAAGTGIARRTGGGGRRQPVAARADTRPRNR